MDETRVEKFSNSRMNEREAKKREEDTGGMPGFACDDSLCLLKTFDIETFSFFCCIQNQMCSNNELELQMMTDVSIQCMKTL